MVRPTSYDGPFPQQPLSEPIVHCKKFVIVDRVGNPMKLYILHVGHPWSAAVYLNYRPERPRTPDLAIPRPSSTPASRARVRPFRRIHRSPPRSPRRPATAPPGPRIGSRSSRREIHGDRTTTPDQAVIHRLSDRTETVIRSSGQDPRARIQGTGRGTPAPDPAYPARIRVSNFRPIHRSYPPSTARIAATVAAGSGRASHSSSARTPCHSSIGSPSWTANPPASATSSSPPGGRGYTMSTTRAPGRSPFSSSVTGNSP